MRELTNLLGASVLWGEVNSHICMTPPVNNIAFEASLVYGSSYNVWVCNAWLNEGVDMDNNLWLRCSSEDELRHSSLFLNLHSHLIFKLATWSHSSLRYSSNQIRSWSYLSLTWPTPAVYSQAASASFLWQRSRIHPPGGGQLLAYALDPRPTHLPKTHPSERAYSLTVRSVFLLNGSPPTPLIEA